MRDGVGDSVGDSVGDRNHNYISLVDALSSIKLSIIDPMHSLDHIPSLLGPQGQYLYTR